MELQKQFSLLDIIYEQSTFIAIVSGNIETYIPIDFYFYCEFILAFINILSNHTVCHL